MSLSLLTAHSYAGQDHEHESPHQDEYKIDEHDEHDEHGDNDHDHDQHAHDEHNEDEHGHEEDGHSDSVTIDALTAEQSGIKTAMARSGDIATTRRVFAKVANDPSQISHIGARFDGTIIQVNASVGDRVKKGMKLARGRSGRT